MSPLLPPHKSVCTPFFAMKSLNSRILCVVHHALGLRHFLALKLKHYKMGVQWYRSKSIRFHSNLKVFPTCGSLCHSFSLRSPYWPLELFLFWTVTFTDCLLQIPFGMTFPPLYWAEYPPNKDYWFHFFFSFFLPWESPSASGLQPYFFFVSDLPTDPQPHQIPHFFLFSDGDTLCLPSQLKIINTKVSISSQGLSSLTDRTLLNCTNSVESSLHSLLSPRSLFFFPLSHLTSWQILLLFPLHYLGEICSFLSVQQTDTWIRVSSLWLNWLSFSYMPQVLKSCLFF